MKLFTALFLIPFLVITASDGCEKKLAESKQQFEVKVVATLCAYTVVEVQTPEFQQLGTDWEQYKHVFKVGNHCDLPADLKEGDLLKCYIIEKPIVEQCASCRAFLETPSLSRNIKVVKLIRNEAK
jgi:hypothetical protein